MEKGDELDTPSKDTQPAERAPGETPLPARSSNTIRKRSKTGCLMCRKRRIKCTGERPVCNNCMKSKRRCDGYSSRLIFNRASSSSFSGPSLPYTTSRYPFPHSEPLATPSTMDPFEVKQDTVEILSRVLEDSSGSSQGFLGSIEHMDWHGTVEKYPVAAVHKYVPELPSDADHDRPHMLTEPLINSGIARRFSHFTRYIGPMISLFERNLTNELHLPRKAIPYGEQCLWIDTLPALALQDQTLLQAMLTLASAHLAGHNKAPLTISLSHKHSTLSNIAQSLGLPDRRKRVQTLAAVLLLAFGDFMTAENASWLSHLHGARQLIADTYVAEKSEIFRLMCWRLKKEQKHLSASSNWQNQEQYFEDVTAKKSLITAEESDIDLVLVDTLMGASVSHDENLNHGNPIEMPQLTASTIKELRIHRDLYWWYCKQDLFQSMINESRPLKPYHQWGKCLPRAGVGVFSAIYGTMDHLVLLMARLIDFGARDKMRKRDGIINSLGEWRNVVSLSDRVPKSNTGHDPGWDTAAAEIEWRDISVAFECFVGGISKCDEFTQVPHYLDERFESPFGESLSYRTYSIGVIWVFYYTGQILLQNMHPATPLARLASPSYMNDTEPYLSVIGRILAGFPCHQSKNSQDVPLNPVLAGALIDIIPALAIIGAQIMDPNQRNWLITKLYEYAKLTGCQSFLALVAKCEDSWIENSEVGLGPRYVRHVNKTGIDAKSSANELSGQIVHYQRQRDAEIMATESFSTTPSPSGHIDKNHLIDNDFQDSSLGTEPNTASNSSEMAFLSTPFPLHETDFGVGRGLTGPGGDLTGPGGWAESNDFKLFFSQSSNTSPGSARTASPCTSLSADHQDWTALEPDTDSDSSSGGSYNGDLIDTDREERLSNPSIYFKKLADLEKSIYNNSWLCRCETIHGSGDDFSLRSMFLYTSGQVCTNHQNCVPRRTLGDETHWQYYQYHQMLSKITEGLRYLQKDGFCGKRFNFLVIDKDRSNVAKMVAVNISDIYDLLYRSQDFITAYGLDECLFCVSELSTLNATNLASSVTQMCEEFIDATGLLSGHHSLRPAQICWYTAHILDLAVLSYVGAHIERFDLTYLDKDLPFIPIRQTPWEDFDIRETTESIVNYSPDCIRLQRRRLQCLDGFLDGREVWVFHPPHYTVQNPQDERLLLSTDVESLGDIWGPLWKTTESETSENILRYGIGNGFMVPWALDSTGQFQSSLASHDEVFCHWFSHRDWSTTDVGTNQRSLNQKTFRPQDRLLIGAESKNGLQVNKDCKTPLPGVKNYLRRKGALRNPRTAYSRRFLDGHTVQVSGSAMGFGGASSFTYKRRKGFDMKDTLVERWRNGLRNIGDLESFYGVEVSLCTRNARRRRLLQILESQTVRCYLEGNSFEWEDQQCATSYFKALRSPKAFRKLWGEHKEWRKQIGNAISICLDALEETGIDKDTGELSALWVHMVENVEESDNESSENGSDSDSGEGNALTTEETFKTAEEWIVTLFRSEHTWTNFLQDSPEILTMAVVTTTCLELDRQVNYGRCCLGPHQKDDGTIFTWTTGYSVLETALLINEELLKNEGLECRKAAHRRDEKYWHTTNLQVQSCFALGDQGRLRFDRRFGDRLLMEWQPVISSKLQMIQNEALREDLLGMNRERHHQEYVRSTRWGVKPLPIFVLSGSTKVRFAKKES